MRSKKARLVVGALLVVVLIAGIVTVSAAYRGFGNRTAVAYFTTVNGIYPGDEVRILGVRVGKIESIEPQPQRVKVTLSYSDKYRLPADVNAVVLSPSLVTARAIQLTPAYTDGPELADREVIPLERTAVPVEWDDFRQQLEKLTDTLQPTEPGGVSTLGGYVNTVADNLRGQGGSIRDTIIKLSGALSALGDHSGDIFGTVKNLSILVSALESSSDTMRQLNQNLAATTGLLANRPNEVGRAVADINAVVDDVQSFVSQNRESVGTTTDKLTSVTTMLHESRRDIEQILHIGPTAFQNFVNIYQPAQGTLTGAFAANNFANPVQFICSAVQAASRLNAEQSAKLCVQYMAPIMKNRQMNFPPLGENLFVGATARPNEVTYSEDWLRPDYVPPAPPVQAPAQAPLAAEGDAVGSAASPLPSSALPTDPQAGLAGIMAPAGQP
ncbi:MCE family protein [Mycolicibacterium vaccae]|uniref:MCE family protein n=1 Tax=Mycolicibacterium vaccae TaxID=1810 RepID=UPI003CFCEC47